MALYDHLRTGAGNLFFSPYSIDTALMMVYAGAAGRTASEMAAALHLPDAIAPDQLHQAVGELIGRLQHPNQDAGYQLHVANALWAQVGVHWLPAYVELLRSDYSAEAFAADFSQPEICANRSTTGWHSRPARGSPICFPPAASHPRRGWFWPMRFTLRRIGRRRFGHPRRTRAISTPTPIPPPPLR